MLKMEVRLDPEMIYCLVASPQWDLQDSLLPDAFTSLVQTRETLKTNLFAPCPDPEPEPDPVPAAPLETRRPELETPGPGTRCPGTPPPPDNTCPETGKPAPAIVRDPSAKKDAKLARKTEKIKKLNEEISIRYARRKKFSGKSAENLFQKLFRRWEKSGKLPGKTPQNEDINQLYQ